VQEEIRMKKRNAAEQERNFIARFDNRKIAIVGHLLKFIFAIH
jgi:hypothetical protein